MPRGSRPGERRGGRTRAVPNKTTALTERILAIAAAHPDASSDDVMSILLKDRALPADVRLTVARIYLPTKAASSGGGANTKTKSSRKARSPWLDALLQVVQDAANADGVRRTAAAEVARHFLPKRHVSHRHGRCQTYDYGFIVNPRLAVELRDARLALRSLAVTKRSDPLRVAEKRKALEARISDILGRLEPPCPSEYGMKEASSDRQCILQFARVRDAGGILSTAQDAEEAIRGARLASLNNTPEAATRARLDNLRRKHNAHDGKRWSGYTRADAALYRFLRVLYPRPSRWQTGPAADMWDGVLVEDHPFATAAFAEDGNLYPSDSRLRPATEDIEEFDYLPPYVIGDPNHPDAVWLDENLQPVKFTL